MIILLYILLAIYLLSVLIVWLGVRNETLVPEKIEHVATFLFFMLCPFLNTISGFIEYGIPFIEKYFGSFERIIWSIILLKRFKDDK